MISDVKQTFDYIIVGAGSAGCVLANRLSANPEVQVLLLESGPKDGNWRFEMPMGFVTLLGNHPFNWNFATTPEPHLYGRKLYCPAGRVVGGSSSINGMVHVRGHDLDFDAWAQSGCRGWSARDVLPYFKRSESYSGPRSERRGHDGPLRVSPATTEQPLDRVFLEAGKVLGFPSTDDFNGAQQEGFGRYDRTIVSGSRESVATAYHAPVKARSNLRLETGVTVARLLLQDSVAVGVEVEDAGRLLRLTAEREIIVCAGAIGSPTLLQRSGIGSAERLQQAGVECVHDLPCVGEGLQNHVEATVQYRCKRPISVHEETLGLRRYINAVNWFLHKRGICATNHWETGAFVKSSSAHYPDIQLIFCPISLQSGTLEPTKWHGFQIHAGFQKPQSRGWVRCRSDAPAVPPEVCLNFFSEASDRSRLAEAVELSRALVESAAFDSYRGHETSPGSAIKSPAQVENWLCANAENSYHLTSSCAMGDSNDERCVVDPNCRVIGLEGMRVVDASIMPEVINANTNAAVVMMAEKAAAMILEA